MPIPANLPALLLFLLRGAIALWADDALDAILKDSDGDGVPDLAEGFLAWLRRRARSTRHKLDDRIVAQVDGWLEEHPENWTQLRIWLDAALQQAVTARRGRAA